MNAYRAAQPKEEMKNKEHSELTTYAAILIGLNGIIYKFFDGGGWNWAFNLDVIFYLATIQTFLLCILYNLNRWTLCTDKINQEVAPGRFNEIRYEWYIFRPNFFTHFCKFGMWISINSLIFKILSYWSNSALSILLLINLIVIPLILKFIRSAKIRTRVYANIGW